MADAALSAGDYEKAQQYAQEAHDLTEETGDRWFLAYCLNQLGLILGALRDLTGAARYFRESYALREQFADAEGMAVALKHLGNNHIYGKPSVRNRTEAVKRGRELNLI